MALFYHSGIFLSIASDDFIVCMFVYLFGSGASVAAVSSARGWHCDSVTAICHRRTSGLAVLSWRFARRTSGDALLSRRFPRRTVGLAFLPRQFPRRASGNVVLARQFPRRTVDDAVLLRRFPRRTSGDAALLRRFALGARPVMWFWRGSFLGARLAMRFCCDDLARRVIGLVALSRQFPRRAAMRFCRGGFLGARPALWLCCGGFLGARLAMLFCCGAFLGVRPAMRLCCGGLLGARPCVPVAASCLGSRLSFFLCQEKRDGLRYLAFLFRRVEIAIRAFSQRSSVICFGGFTSGLAVYLWRSRRVTGVRRTGIRG